MEEHRSQSINHFWISHKSAEPLLLCAVMMRGCYFGHSWVFSKDCSCVPANCPSPTSQVGGWGVVSWNCLIRVSWFYLTDIFWTAEDFATKLGTVVHHHVSWYCAKCLDMSYCCLQGQGYSYRILGDIFWTIEVFATKLSLTVCCHRMDEVSGKKIGLLSSRSRSQSHLLNPQKWLIVLYLTIEDVHFKLSIMGYHYQTNWREEGQSHRVQLQECLSITYLLNHLTLCDQSFYAGASLFSGWSVFWSLGCCDQGQGHSKVQIFAVWKDVYLVCFEPLNLLQLNLVCRCVIIRCYIIMGLLFKSFEGHHDGLNYYIM